MENGAGMLTVFRQLVGEAFGLPLERVAIVQTLAGIEYDRGIGGSRITRLLGTMIGILGERLQRRLAGLLAAELGQRPERIAVEPGGFRAPDGRFHPLADVAALADAGLVELLRYEPGPFDRVEVFAAQAAEVELDGETGQVRVRRAVTAHEVGKVVNPLLHQGQIDGGLVQGLGFALTEGLVLDEGRVVNANFHEYKLPTVADVPRLETILLPPDPSLGITPIGEGPNCGMSAAIVNAVADAIARLRGEGAAGSPRLEIPITPEQVMAKLRTG
jgi:CO/xanthine dehydrogenase Mo-binding subunit